MKDWIALTGVVLVTGVALIWSEERKADVPVGPGAILYFIADTQRELARLPVTFKPVPDEEEIKIGDTLAQIYEAQGEAEARKRRSSAIAVGDYVREVGARVGAHAHRKLPYRFHYIDQSRFLNAFALPGGHVFIGNGLIALMDSEDELAAVLGHEIEHIDHYHCAERVQVEAALRKIPLGRLVAVPVEVFEAGYSKEQELEADREGTRLAVASSYSPLGALRMFETFDRLYREYVTKAQTPQEELATVAVQTLAGYFRSHPLPSERIDQVHRMILDQGWGGLNRERMLRVAYVFWTERAQRAAESHHYDQAARFAAHSLELQPEQPEALDVLAQAQFMMADFEDASESYLKLLQGNPTNVGLASRYAYSLSAWGESKKAMREFNDWLSHAKISDPDVVTQIKIDQAGLVLLTGSERPAAALDQQLKQRADAVWAPDCFGRLGSWYYRAGRYATSASLLNAALQQRPQETAFQIQLGWTLIEQRNYESAIQRFTQSQGSRGSGPGAAMGLAVAYWQSGQTEKALSYYTVAIDAEPFWGNERWVRAFYAPTAVRGIAGMQMERQHRLEEENRKRLAAR